MDQAWRDLSMVMKVAFGAGFITMMFFVFGSLLMGRWRLATYAGGVVLFLAWSFGPVEALRLKTTERLSRSQTLALALLALVGYWLWRFLLADDGSVYLGTGIAVLVVWLILTVRTEGWTKRSD